MRFNDILTVVPMIALSGCSLDDLLQPPTTLQPNVQLDAGELVTWPTPLRDETGPDRRTSHNDRTPTATTSTNVAPASDSTSAAQQGSADIPTFGDPFSGSTAPLPVVTSNTNETHTNVTATSTSTTSPGTAPSGNPWPTTSAQEPNGTNGSTASNPGSNATTTSHSSAPTSNETTVVPTQASDAGSDPSADTDLDAGATQEPNPTDVSPDTNTFTNPSNTSAQTNNTTEPSDPTSEPETCETLLTEGFEDIALLSQSGWVPKHELAVGHHQLAAR